MLTFGLYLEFWKIVLNFICVIFILDFGLMEVLNSQLRKILAEQVARASDRKTLSCNIP
jgi:hypothetical protein